jgi:hypothetical protein
MEWPLGGPCPLTLVAVANEGDTLVLAYDGQSCGYKPHPKYGAW